MSRRTRRVRRRQRRAARGLDELTGKRPVRSARDFRQLVWIEDRPVLLNPWDAAMFRSFERTSVLLSIFEPLPKLEVTPGVLDRMPRPVSRSRFWRDPFTRG